jgi:hypothetical protein
VIGISYGGISLWWIAWPIAIGVFAWRAWVAFDRFRNSGRRRP